MQIARNGLIGALAMLAAASASYSQEAPVPVAEAAQRFTLPAGFQATLFAGEPDLVQPIAFTFDDRGRLWVIENYSYPGWSGESKDRVLIFADHDGDGRFDERKVFLENGNNLSGIEWGFGGVWLCSTPNLVFVPDADANDVADGPPVVKLDGWDLHAKHNAFNSLAWGPDGWLYGCNGILSNSKVGAPGTSEAQRTSLNCGVWRYHPTRGEFEVVAQGTTNPWGIDFDEFGQTFITNCVIKHLWHVVPGAHFQRMFGQDGSPNSYALMESCADHIHWSGGPWYEARGGERDNSHGGGHAHVGAMAYLGDNWPDKFRNHLFTCNLHGNRVNQDVLERQGSGYVARHGRDLMLAGDPWFRGLAIKYGPDGGVFVSDWTDTGECHNYEVADRSNGRIYKISYGRPQHWATDLSRLSDAELVEFQTHKNEWVVRHARRLLQERAAHQQLKADTTDQLLAILQREPDVPRKLHALWSLHAVGATTEALLLRTMDDEHDVVRGWAVQLALESRQPSPEVLAQLTQMSKTDLSAWVRLAIAAGVQRIRLQSRWNIIAALAAHAEDASDANLPLMIWYALEPLVEADPSRAIELAQSAKIPMIRQYIARRIATPAEVAGLSDLVKLAAHADDALQSDVVAGMHEALQGRRRVDMPQGWTSLYSKLAASKVESVRERGMLLALIFGDQDAQSQLRAVVADAQVDPAVRCQAIAALTHAKSSDLTPLLRELLSDSAVRVAALRGLAAFDDAAAPAAILSRYPQFDAESKREAVSALASRGRYALALIDAIDQQSIPRSDLSAFDVQQLQNLNNAHVAKWLNITWGAVRQTPADRAALIQEYKSRLTPAVLAAADRSRGRAVFDRTCAGCHTLFDSGGRIGPELTGSQRDNIDYVLTNVLDPSAMVAKDYQMTLVTTNDGRAISGIVTFEDEHSLTMQTATESLIVPKVEIESRETHSSSMMPDGLLTSLGQEEIRDLLAYLAGTAQAPPPNQPGGGSGTR